MRGERPVVAYLFEPMETGQSFDDWPLHITLAPSLNRDVSDVYDAVVQSTTELQSFPITIGVSDYFGEDASVQVLRLQPERELRQLHQSILAKLGGVAAVIALPDEWVGPRYSPHVTPKSGQRELNTGEEYTLDRLTILRKESGRRIVHHIVELSK